MPLPRNDFGANITLFRPCGHPCSRNGEASRWRAIRVPVPRGCSDPGQGSVISRGCVRRVKLGRVSRDRDGAPGSWFRVQRSARASRLARVHCRPDVTGPRTGHRRYGLVRCPDYQLKSDLCPGRRSARPQRSRLDQRHDKPDGGMDCALDNGGISLGRCPGISHSRLGSDLRHHHKTPIGRYGHPG